MTFGDRLRRLIGRPRLQIPEEISEPARAAPAADERSTALAWLETLAGRLAAGDKDAPGQLEPGELDRRLAAISTGGPPGSTTPRLVAEWLDKLAVAAPAGKARDAMRARAAEIYLARGETAAAIPLLEALTASEEHAARAHFLLGEHHQRQGDRRQALRHFEAVLARDLAYPNTRARAEALRSALGKQHAAAGHAGVTLAGVDGQVTAGSRYRLLAEIGRGATGAVYRARDTELERDVAVKLLHPHLGGRGTLSRFFAEARTAAALRHPSIVAVLDLDEEHRRIVMELLGGGTLRERLLHGPLPPGEAVARHAEIMSALVSAHRRAIVHRDLKPGNLLFRREWRDPAIPTEIVLCDFGSAHLGATTTEASATGTLRYMAPEQRRGVASPAGDLWAAGLILYEMIAGLPPLGLADAPPEGGLILPDGAAPAEIAAHVAELTRPDPARRPGGDEALARARSLEATLFPAAAGRA